MNSNKYLVIIIFLSLSLLASIYLILRTTVFFGRAATPNTSSIAWENSYIFASPLQAKADGQELIRITAFLLDGRGIGVPNFPVKLDLPSNVKITSVQSSSDDSGKVIFDLSSSTPGKVTVSASVADKAIPQTVKIVFY